MKGSILAYGENKGVVSGHDGNRYEFVRMDWSGTKEPIAGMEIDFTVDGSQAKSIFPIVKEQPSKHSRAGLAALAFFFGGLGIHRFVVGKIVSGVVMLILFLCIFAIPFLGPFTAGFALIAWVTFDFLSILIGSFTDKDGNKVTNW